MHGIACAADLETIARTYASAPRSALANEHRLSAGEVEDQHVPRAEGETGRHHVRRRRVVRLEQVTRRPIDQRHHELAAIHGERVPEVTPRPKLHTHAGTEIERRIAAQESPAAQKPGRSRIVERGLSHAGSRRRVAQSKRAEWVPLEWQARRPQDVFVRLARPALAAGRRAVARVADMLPESPSTR